MAASPVTAPSAGRRRCATCRPTRFSRQYGVVPRPSRPAEQGTFPFIGLDDELSALRDEVARLQTENARLLRLLELTPRQARPPGPVQTGVSDGEAEPVQAGSPTAAKVAFSAASSPLGPTCAHCAGRTRAAVLSARRPRAAVDARADHRHGRVPMGRVAPRTQPHPRDSCKSGT